MSLPNFDKETLDRLISELIDGELDASGRRALNAMLLASAQARRQYRRQMDVHARLHLNGTSGMTAEMMCGTNTTPSRRSPRAAWAVGMAAAACILSGVMLTRQFSMQGSQEQTFATLLENRAVIWEASDLPTTPGSRLGKGTMRLAEGLVELRFDSGAAVTLEGPADVTLGSAMEFTLTKGAVNATVPESAKGFRIGTPSANIIDHGTKFSVNVEPDSGLTLTRVYEGLVDVEHLKTGEKRRLKAGNESLTSELGFEAGDNGIASLIGPPARGADWVILPTHKDAYVGRVYQDGEEVHRSESLLLVKKSIDGGADRNAYLGFDLSGVDRKRIAEAMLTVHMAPTGWGLASHVPDASFSIYGLLTDESWDEDSMKRSGPPIPMTTFRDPKLTAVKVRNLGSFEVPQGLQSGKFLIEGNQLVSFLADYPEDQLTLVLVRDTREVQVDGLVHGFASRRHPDLPAPKLSIRLEAR